MYALILSPPVLFVCRNFCVYIATSASRMHENHDRFNNIGSSGESYS